MDGPSLLFMGVLKFEEYKKGPALVVPSIWGIYDIF